MNQTPGLGARSSGGSDFVEVEGGKRRRDGIILRVHVIRIGTGGNAPSRLVCAIKIAGSDAAMRRRWALSKWVMA
jgi:hypothetical protein